MSRWTWIASALGLVLVAAAVPDPALAAKPCRPVAQAGGDPAPPQALFELAQCHEQAGRTKTAVDQYAAFLKSLRRLDAAAREPLAGPAATAKERLAALRGRVPLLTIELPGDPSDYEVRIDGREAAVESLEYARPIDPGLHRIEVEMPDGSVHRFDEHLAEGDSRVVRVPSSRGSSSAADETQEPDEPFPAAASADDGSGIPMRTWAYVAGGVGAAGIVVGAITGGMAIGKKPTMDDNCDGDACNHEGKVAADEVQDLALGSTIGFTVGFVGLGAGAALWFLFPEEEEAEATETAAIELSPWIDGAILGVRGAW